MQGEDLNKIISKAVILISSFLLCWFAIAQVDWINIFKIEEISNKLDEKLGDIFNEYILESENVIENPDINNPVESISRGLCKANHIKSEHLKILVIKNDEVNAFALPGNQLVIYSGLINESKNQYELAGVIAHELAHLQKGHIKRKLIKEVGLSALLSISGGGNGELIKETIKLLSSSAYDRELETEADYMAIIYLQNAGINPVHLSDFLERLSYKSPDQKYFSWISTHPNTKERVNSIREKKVNTIKENRALLTDEDWNQLKELIKDLE